MKKWEYRIVNSKNVPSSGLFKGKRPSDVEAYLNELGNDGWEIRSLDFNHFGTRLEFLGVARREKQLKQKSRGDCQNE